MKNIVGMPVLGNDFFGRESELLDLKKTAADQHVLLLAPRRVGKTSLLHALQQKTTEERARVGVYVSVAAGRSETDFVKMVFAAIHQTRPGKKLRPNVLSRWIDRRKQRVKKVGAVGASLELEYLEHSWQSGADESFTRLLELDRSWLIMIDELPTLVMALAEQDPTGTRVRTFLHWFRTLRQRPDAATKLRFVLAGSIGLDTIEELLNRKIYFSSWEERLRDTFGIPDDAHARTVLAACASASEGAQASTLHAALARSIPDPEARDSTVKWILDVLMHDGYLVLDEDRWRFRSGLLRRYWQRNHV